MRAMSSSATGKQLDGLWHACRGAASRPGAVRGPLGARLIERSFVDQRAALPVVQVALLAREARRRALDEAALEKPSGGARRQHEEPRELELLRPLLDLVQQRGSVAGTAEVRMHRERRQLADALPGEGVERSATDDR